MTIRSGAFAIADALGAIAGALAASSCCGRPAEEPGWSWQASSGPTMNRDRPTPWPTSWGCATLASKWTNLQAVVDRLAADGYGLVGGIGQYEDIWRIGHVRGPEGIIVSLAPRVD